MAKYSVFANGMKQQWGSRIHTLLGVSVDVSDGTSPYSHVQYVPDSPGAPIGLNGPRISGTVPDFRSMVPGP